MKYRILEIPTIIPDEPYYQAQFKFLNLFWMNCDPNDDIHFWGCSFSIHLEKVERYIEQKIQSHKPPKIVKIYES